MRSCLLFWCCICLPLALHAQLAKVLEKARPEAQMEVLLRWLDQYQDRQSALPDQWTRELAAAANVQGLSPAVAQRLWTQQQLARLAPVQDAGERIGLLTELADEATAKGWPDAAALARFHMAQHFYGLRRYGAAFHYFKAYHQHLQQPGQQPLDRLVAAHLIGYYYYHFKDYQASIPYLKEALVLRSSFPGPGLHSSLKDVTNTLGLSHQHLGNYDTALRYFEQSLALARADGDSTWVGLTHGNIGHCYQLLGRLNEALPFLKKDYQLSTAGGQLQSGINAAGLILDIYRQLNQWPLVAQWLDSVEARNPHLLSVHTQANFFQHKYLLLRQQGQLAQASLYQDSFMKARDSLSNLTNRGLMSLATQQAETSVEEFTGRVKLAESERKLVQLRYLLALALLLLSAGIAIYFLNRKRLLQSAEKRVAERKAADAEQQLRSAEQELAMFTQKLREQTNVLADLQEQLAQKTNHPQGDGRQEALEKLLQQSLLTDADWLAFRQLFEQVHPGWLEQIKQLLPELTPAEQRLLALTRLQLIPREMAVLLGISPDSVRKTRNRLHQKLSPPAAEELNRLLGV